MSPAERNEQASAAPRPVALGGRVFLIAKSRPADFITVRHWLLKHARRRPIAEVVPDLAGLPPELQRVVLEKAAEKFLDDGPLDPDECFSALTSPAGCRFLFWVHARANHPGLRLEDLEPLIDDGNAAEVFLELDRATGMSALGGAMAPPGRPP